MQQVYLSGLYFLWPACFLVMKMCVDVGDCRKGMFDQPCHLLLRPGVACGQCDSTYSVFVSQGRLECIHMLCILL